MKAEQEDNSKVNLLVAVTGSLLPGSNGRPERASLNQAYLAALEDAGLAPVILSPKMSAATVKSLIGAASGLVLTGGGDIDPTSYGEEPAGTLMASVSRERDAMEMLALDDADRRGIPVLAICRGMQLLNVHRGGSLVQDIGSQIEHTYEHSQTPEHPRQALTHNVSLLPGSRLGRIIGEERFGVNSMHHQAVKRPGANLVEVARADDGVAEGLEEPGERFVVGVQWHPEELVPGDARARRLFAAFAAACPRGHA